MFIYVIFVFFFFFKQKTAYDMRISDWSSDVCSSDLLPMSTSFAMSIRSLANLRIDSSGPSTASGGMMALTREPSAGRASTIGCDSSTRRREEERRVGKRGGGKGRSRWSANQ